jgi:hypothetical protein
VIYDKGNNDSYDDIYQALAVSSIFIFIVIYKAGMFHNYCNHDHHSFFFPLHEHSL